MGLSQEEEMPEVEEQMPDTEEVLLRLREKIEEARAMPLSSSVLVEKEQMLAVIDEAADSLPEELRRARWLLREREDILAESRREAEQIIAAAKAEAARRVDKTELVRQATSTAEKIRSDADAAARQMRHEAEDYVDQKLATFEVVLDRTMQTVHKGRERLNLIPEDEPDIDLTAENEFFDQDQQEDQLT